MKFLDGQITRDDVSAEQARTGEPDFWRAKDAIVKRLTEESNELERQRDADLAPKGRRGGWNLRRLKFKTRCGNSRRVDSRETPCAEKASKINWPRRMPGRPLCLRTCCVRLKSPARLLAAAEAAIESRAR